MAKQGAETTETPVPGGHVLDGGVVIVDTPPSEEEVEEELRAVLGAQEEHDLTDDDFFSSDEDDDATDDEEDDAVDSDSEFEEDDDQPPLWPAFLDRVVVDRATFLGRLAGVATVQSTVAFMRHSAYSSASHGGHGGGEILVNYRYTRFLKAQGGGDGVDMHVLGPKQARFRFRTSLRLAGAALAPLIYPARFSEQLQVLWCALLDMAPPVRVPAQATRLEVTVDAGILRPGDFAPERMERVCVAMKRLAREREAHPAPCFDAVTELQLPVPVEAEDDVRPAKRRRITGEDCPICFEAMVRGLVAWPRCSHIFHAGCLEPHLRRGSQECPMCRTNLRVSGPQ
ncbi:hypothetical protein BS78_K238400 [Paspalum vaginatum]|uniref:RING-type domain-containing protein n=1 Tax=Paspalum vaginatum TaxID=158149 RepID=A0A9W7XED9_9POAL|nr:hypothetical protein BS78_K238400 [Paspalum vaginatum]